MHKMLTLLCKLGPLLSHTIYLLVKAQVPISIFFAGPVGEISKSKISIGNPSVVHAFGICEKKNISQ
jgi:hypothetical protein